jgi:hypothetical protein
MARLEYDKLSRRATLILFNMGIPNAKTDIFQFSAPVFIHAILPGHGGDTICHSRPA